MKQYTSKAIVLRRVNYGEADRIVTFLTPENGKVGAMAKGVRKPKSKLAGALEPFSVATITFGEGKGNLGIVISTRLNTFYGNIITEYERLQFGYEAIKLIDRSTEDVVDAPFFELLHKAFVYLNELKIDYRFTELWFRMQLEELLGRSPDLSNDGDGNPLSIEKKYVYDPTERGLVESQFGTITADHIKLLRLAKAHSPAVLVQVTGAGKLIEDCRRMMLEML